MAKDFYIIIKGKRTGIFEDWEEVKNYVDKYPNYQYKGFYYREKEEAIKYMKSYKVNYSKELNRITNKNEETKNNERKEKYYKINSDIYSHLNRTQLIKLFIDIIIDKCLMTIYKNIDENDIDFEDKRGINYLTENYRIEIETYIRVIRAMTKEPIEIENILDDNQYIVYKIYEKIIYKEKLEENNKKTIKLIEKLQKEINLKIIKEKRLIIM